MSFPFYPQLDSRDCGPACLRMIAKFYGKEYSLGYLREKSTISREGVSLMGLSDAAEAIGMRNMGVRITMAQLAEAPLPCIAHWKQSHFVVVYNITKNGEVVIADPGRGILQISQEEFKKAWLSTRQHEEDLGVALLLDPTPDFYARDDVKQDRSSFSFLFQYLKPQHKLVVQLILGMLLGSLLQLAFPFLTQSIVDKGIIGNNPGFIYIILIAQLVFIVGRTSVDFIRNWILLHLSTRINLSLISDFLVKLMKLPIGFFDAKLIGDLMQRIGDHNRIQNFLTNTSLNVLFGMFNIFIFSIVLGIYSLKILIVFLVGSAIYFLWIMIFLKRRRALDALRFSQLAENQSSLIQMITGMQEIKLNNCERQKRWKWEQIQAKLFQTQMKSLNISQYQQLGGLFFNETKNILITFMSAFAVLHGEMTLGMMVALQYILGQMNGPINQMVFFMQSAQDARISLERLGEIHMKRNEQEGQTALTFELPDNLNLKVEAVSFQYEGPHSPMVLNDINMNIPQGKVTAIVGASGSGKTTLVKLLLGFYPPTSGEIVLGHEPLNSFDAGMWRSHFGAVMQDGFIFSESIAHNIAPGEDVVDVSRLQYAANMANLDEYIAMLPLAYNTVIGMEGSGLSQGQKQRILIARAVYKNPQFLFLDEATNALDATNEHIIHDNLSSFFKGKTVVIVAHRLSTVKNADQIIVLEKGCIVEEGTHTRLVQKQGVYFNLVKNQLELGA